MAIPRATAAAVLTAIALGATPQSAFADSHLQTVVLHVTDYSHMPAKELEQAERLASDAYARVGVDVIWTDGCAAQAGADEALHLDVVILTAAMTARRHPPALAFGQAAHETRHAFIYGARITEHAFQTGSDPRWVLGLVLAHEVGHMLLPTYGHTPSGLMRAFWEGRVVAIPDFLPAQAATIRTQLAANDQQ